MFLPSREKYFKNVSSQLEKSTRAAAKERYVQLN